jgi:Vacuolar protein sorting-associated protein 26
MATYFFSSPVDVDIRLEGEDVRKQVESKAEKDRPVSCPVYYDGESVSGQVRSTYVFSFSPSFIQLCAVRDRLQSAFETENARHMMGSKSSLWET